MAGSVNVTATAWVGCLDGCGALASDSDGIAETIIRWVLGLLRSCERCARTEPAFGTERRRLGFATSSFFKEPLACLPCLLASPRVHVLDVTGSIFPAGNIVLAGDPAASKLVPSIQPSAVAVADVYDLQLGNCPLFQLAELRSITSLSLHDVEELRFDDLLLLGTTHLPELANLYVDMHQLELSEEDVSVRLLHNVHPHRSALKRLDVRVCEVPAAVSCGLAVVLPLAVGAVSLVEEPQINQAPRWRSSLRAFDLRVEGSVKESRLGAASQWDGGGTQQEALLQAVFAGFEELCVTYSGAELERLLPARWLSLASSLRVLSIPRGALDTHCDAVSNAAYLTSLTVGGPDLTTAGLRAALSVPNLRQLHFSGAGAELAKVTRRGSACFSLPQRKASCLTSLWLGTLLWRERADTTDAEAAAEEAGLQGLLGCFPRLRQLLVEGTSADSPPSPIRRWLASKAMHPSVLECRLLCAVPHAAM